MITRNKIRLLIDELIEKRDLDAKSNRIHNLGVGDLNEMFINELKRLKIKLCSL